VLKALALGAKFCFVGRPIAIPRSSPARRGVRRAIGLMREEVDRDMALAGARNIGEVTAELVRRVGQGSRAAPALHGAGGHLLREFVRGTCGRAERAAGLGLRAAVPARRSVAAWP
jgi:hypothetical protein